jgi:molybdopterin molybdotransferase
MRVMAVDDAAAAILAAVPRQPALRVRLADALGHVLAEDVVADVALPPWTNASMDGYAVRGADVRGACVEVPHRLRVVGVIAAGDAVHVALGPGEAMRIFTGAPVPAGADSVVRQEDTDRGSDTVGIVNDRDVGANVRPAGGDVAQGAVALTRGSVLHGRQIALLAALAVTDPVVHRRPRVGVLAMGDELVAPDHREAILSGAKLADVNGPALAALVTEAGGVAVPLGIAADDADALHAMIAAADDVDLLITVGGASVGDHDHVRAVMQRLGVATLFDRVRMRPGGPTTFGLLPDGRPWLALPGNPVSAMVTFELFGRTAIRAMAGHPAPLRRRFRALLANDVRRDAALDQYVRCTFAWPTNGGTPTATLTGPQGSGMLMSMVRAEGLVIVSHGEGMCAADSGVEAVEFGAER